MTLAPGTGAVVGRLLTPEPERELPQDPVAWTQDVLGEHLWSMQRRVMRSVVENRRTYVPSAHGTGKSYTASRLAAWWIAAHPIGEAFVVTSAPTSRQVEAILWRYIARVHRTAGLPGRITLDANWYVGPRGAEELVAYGRKPQDLSDPQQAMQAFQGIHERYVLVLLDEATGIPPWLWDAAGTLLTNESARMLAIGNPDDPSSRFAEECSPGSDAEVLHISAFDLPAYTGEPVPEYLRELLTGRTWVEEMRRAWGEDSPLWTSKVLGQFPEDAGDTRVITPSLVAAAQRRELVGSERGAYGMDVARFGDSESAIYRSRGGVVRLVDAWRKAATTETEGRARRALDRHGDPGARGAPPMLVDAVGVGAGPYDHLREDGYTVAPFGGGERPRDQKRFKNRRTESWWSFREDMADGLVDLDPDDDALAGQLQGPRWHLDSRGRIVMETKEEMRKRGVKSPDRADAAIMAREAERHAGLPSGYRSQRRRRRRDDPTADLLRRPM